MVATSRTLPSSARTMVGRLCSAEHSWARLIYGRWTCPRFWPFSAIITSLLLERHDLLPFPTPHLFIQPHGCPAVEVSPERHEIIIKALGGRRLTTIELEAVLESEGARCPDDLARSLNVMRRKGLIRGEVSVERGGWVWWAGDEEE